MNQQALAKNYIKEFCELFSMGMSNLIEAGKKLAEANDKIPGFVKLMMESCPQFTERFLRKMINVGHGALHPELLIGESSGERRLAKLSYSWQERYATNPVTLLLKKEKGFDELLVPVRDLTPEQCNQVFTDDAIRTAAQQRVYLESLWARKVAPPVKNDLPYRIVGRKVVMMAGASFERRDMLRILQEME